MPQITLTHADGSTDTIPVTAGWKHKREIGKMERLRVSVPRDDAQSVTLEPKSDELELEGVFTGRLVDVETGGSTWTLVAYSFEWDAKQTKPTSGGVTRSGTDNDLVTSFIDDVSTWTAGSIATLTGSMTFVFNHAFAHEALRRIERNVPGELQFNDDKTVDYVDSLGTDKSGSVTLSASNGNLNGDIRVQNKGRALDATHLRVIGAHEGEAQLSATLVPSDDSATYENRVDYTTDRWSSGDPRNWDRWSNKDVSDQATIEEEAAALADDIKRELVEAEATVEGEDLALGDWVHVSKPEANIDRDMRVHRIRTVSEGAKVVDKVLLSTRTVAREGNTDRMRDVQRFNVAFQGSSVVLQGGGDRQPVTSGDNVFVPFRYPDVSYEHVAELEVRGLPYRAFSSGAADNSDLTNIEQSGNNLSTTSIGEDYTTIDSFTINSSPNISSLYATIYLHNSQDDLSSLSEIFLYDVTDGTEYPGNEPNPAMNLDKTASFNATVQKDVSGHTFEWRANTDPLNSGGSLTYSWWFQTAGKHTHDPNPGLFESFPNHPQADANGNLLPSGCDVLVNGSNVATDIGGGEFETVVNITDSLNRGAWNTIEVTSDSIGHILATPYIETYKQIGSK